MSISVSRYSLRYGLCATHLYADELPLGGPGAPLQRFCQKCSSLHTLDAFDGAKHSCSAQLERQRSRRAARAAAARAAAPPPPPPPKIKREDGLAEESPPSSAARSAVAAAPAAASEDDGAGGAGGAGGGGDTSGYLFKGASCGVMVPPLDDGMMMGTMGMLHMPLGAAFDDALAELTRWDGPSAPAAAVLRAAARAAADAPALPAAPAVPAAPAAPALARSWIDAGPSSAPAAAASGVFAPPPSFPPLPPPQLLLPSLQPLPPPPPLCSGVEDLRSLYTTWNYEDCLAASAAVASPPWIDVRIKLPSSAPTALPAALRDALRTLLDPATTGVHAAVEPGCTLLTLGGVCMASASSGLAVCGAEEAARALLRGVCGGFFAAQRGFTVSLRPGDAARVRQGTVVASPPRNAWSADAQDADDADVRVRFAAALPAALRSDAAVALRVLLPAGAAARFRVRCRVHGQFLSVALTEEAAPPSSASASALLRLHVLSFPPCAASGLALLELRRVEAMHAEAEEREGALLHGGCATSEVVVPMLLTSDAAIASEVASLRRDGNSEEVAAVCACLGHALRRRGDAEEEEEEEDPAEDAPPATLLCVALRASLARGWLATAAALLPRCGADAAAACGSGRGGAPSLLHAALCAPAPVAALSLVLRRLCPRAAAAAAAAAGLPDDDDDDDATSDAFSSLLPGGVTALHLAAAHPDASVAAAAAQLLLQRFPGGAGAAWALARDAAGRTPSDVARTAYGSGDGNDAAAMRALDGAARSAVAAAALRATEAAADAEEEVVAQASAQSAVQRRASALRRAADALSLARDPLAAALLRRAHRALHAPHAPQAPTPHTHTQTTHTQTQQAQQRRGGALRRPWLSRLPRMPGAFADAEMESDWLSHVGRLMTFPDLVGYPAAAAAHGAQLVAVWRHGGGAPSAHQAAHLSALMLLVPMLMRCAPAWFLRNREAVHAFMRLLGSCMLPVWLAHDASSSASASSTLFDDAAAFTVVSKAQQLVTLFGMVFFSLAAVVRAPLHVALQGASFAVTVALHGITAHLPLRLGVAALNLSVVIAMERASRRRFKASWRRAAKAASGKGE
jgi:hypothetical protein